MQGVLRPDFLQPNGVSYTLFLNIDKKKVTSSYKVSITMIPKWVRTKVGKFEPVSLVTFDAKVLNEKHESSF